MTSDTPLGGKDQLNLACSKCKNAIDYRRLAKMVNNCCVFGCRSRVGLGSSLRFFRFPLGDRARCSKWTAAVRRVNWKPTPHTRICSKHFIQGKPHTHPSHPDYVPSIFPEAYQRTDKGSTSRVSRLVERTLQIKNQQEEMHRKALDDIQRGEEAVYRAEAEKTLSAEMEYRCVEGERIRSEMEAKEEERRKEQLRMEEERKEQLRVEEERRREEQQRIEEERHREEQRIEEERKREEQRRIEEERRRDEQCRIEEERRRDEQCRIEEERRREEQRRVEEERRREEMIRLNELGVLIDASSQTDDCAHSLQSIKKENELLKSQLEDSTFGIRAIEANDEKTKFYTGLPSWSVFLHLFLFLSPPPTPFSKLSLENEFFLVLVRLRLGLLLEDLAARFKISSALASRLFQKWLDIMFVRLSFLIGWPDREICKRNMPAVFKELYPKCRCIIDCSEIFIETPKNFSARSKTYSNYKKHNTIKFLIGITPFGTICFLSECWGGRVSDKNLTQVCNFLNLLEHGDTILADRGFTIADDLAIHGAKLEIPSFTRGKQQLSQRDVELSKQLSRVRIHVERVIGLLKNKYLILRGPLGINLLKHKGDEGVANIDKILTVCCALTNLSVSIV